MLQRLRHLVTTAPIKAVVTVMTVVLVATSGNMPMGMPQVIGARVVPSPGPYIWDLRMILCIIIGGFLCGVISRLMRMHQDPTPLRMGLYSTVTILVFTLAWRGGAYWETGRDWLHDTDSFVLAAAILGIGAYAGKWCARRVSAHRHKNETSIIHLNETAAAKRSATGYGGRQRDGEPASRHPLWPPQP